MRTYSMKLKEIDKNWKVIDADGRILGRLASEVAMILLGKNKAEFSRHLDMGDNVVIINADKIKVSGQKDIQKVYRHHSGYIGSLKEIPYKRMAEIHPDFIIKHAVKGMLPGTKLGRKLLKNLKIYTGPDHPHSAQVNKKKVKIVKTETKAKAAPVEKAVKAESVKKPVKASPKEKVVKTEPVKKSVKAAHREKVAKTEPVKKPVKAAPKEKVAKAESKKKPEKANPVKKAAKKK